jgi:poly-gamma-glutamate synthesis protein (capsule biosynthesis protein)
MMFDRGVAVTAKKNGFDYVFGPATTTIAAHDITVANLEGPVTSYKSKLILDSGKAISGFQFTFSPATAPAVKKAGIDIVSLANNHTDNFGQAGLDQTRTYLKNNAIQYFGSPVNNADLMATTTCMKDICVGLIGWHEFSYKGDANVVKKIQEFKAQGLDYIVVYPHWGIEYKKTPSKKQVQLARSWLDAGADAVIGSHPHVIQSVEKYKDKYIFYSLGNFIFDQYFSFDTTHGMGVSINLSKGKNPEYKIVPFTNVGNKVSLPTADEILKMFKGIDLGGVMVQKR